MATVATSKRVAQEDEPGAYELTLEDGRMLRLAKEFYADGPSLFTWVLTGEGEWREFSTKKAALRYVGEEL